MSFQSQIRAIAAAALSCLPTAIFAAKDDE
jgi:hypothetical protein